MTLRGSQSPVRNYVLHGLEFGDDIHAIADGHLPTYSSNPGISHVRNQQLEGIVTETRVGVDAENKLVLCMFECKIRERSTYLR